MLRALTFLVCLVCMGCADCQNCRIGGPYRDTQDRLLWRDKTRPARAKLINSWKANFNIIIITIIIIIVSTIIICVWCADSEQAGTPAGSLQCLQWQRICSCRSPQVGTAAPSHPSLLDVVLFQPPSTVGPGA